MQGFTVTRNISSGLLKNVDTGMYRRSPANWPLSDGEKGMRFPPLWTNHFRNSEPASSPGHGTTQSLSYVSNPFGQFELDGGVIFDNMSGPGPTTATYYNTTSLPAGNYTCWFLLRRSDGQQPVLGNTYDLVPRCAGSNMAVFPTIRVPGTDVYLGYAWGTITGGESEATRALNGMRKQLTDSNNVVTVSAINFISGHITISRSHLADYLRTTGTAVTAPFPVMTRNIGIWSDLTIQCKFRFDNYGTPVLLWTYGQDIQSAVRLIRSDTNRIIASFRLGASNKVQIQSNNTFETGDLVNSVLKFTPEGIKLFINNELQTNYTVGNENIPFVPNASFNIMSIGQDHDSSLRAHGMWLEDFKVYPFMSEQRAQELS